jgi:hypothetical protein
MPTNDYIRGRVAQAREKRALTTKALTNNQTLLRLPFAQLMTWVNKDLKSHGFTTGLGQWQVRKLRHAARKAAGLPYDGISYPPRRSQPGVGPMADRRKMAYDWARSHPGCSITEVQEAVRSQDPSGHRVSFAVARAAVRAASRYQRTHQQANGNGGEEPQQTQLRLDTQPDVRARQLSDTGLSRDFEAAVQLLIEAAKAEHIHDIRVTIDESGSAKVSGLRKFSEVV